MPAEFIDTNILVYAYDLTAGRKHDRAQEIMEKLWASGEGVLSTQVLQEFYATVTGKIPQPITPRQARAIVRDFGTWTVALLGMREILEGSELAERYRLNFWDGLILSAALKEEASILWSEDFSHGQNYAGVAACSPFVG